MWKYGLGLTGDDWQVNVPHLLLSQFNVLDSSYLAIFLRTFLFY